MTGLASLSREFAERASLVRPGSPECEKICARIDTLVQQGSYKLPVLPETVFEVLRLSRDPSSSIDSVARVLSSEPTIVARVVAVANSPFFYRGHAAIRSGKDAVVRLGLLAIRDLVMQAVMSSHLFDNPRFAPRMAALRVNATGCAYACRWLETFSPFKNEWVFLSGLLHHLGNAVLLEILTRKEFHAAPAAAIDELLEIRHAAVGGVVAEKLGLPEPVCRAIARHHDPVDPEDLLPSYVVAGELLWTAAADKRPEDREAFEAAPATLALGLDRSKHDAIVDGMVKAVPECLAAAGAR